MSRSFKHNVTVQGAGPLRKAIEQRLQSLRVLVAVAREAHRTDVIGHIQNAIRELEYAKNKEKPKREIRCHKRMYAG